MPNMDAECEVEELACNGDPRAFGELLRRWDDDLRGLVWSVVRDADQIDDVLQSAYEKAFRSLAEFRGEAALKTWVYSVCLRTAIDHQRYEKRRQHESDHVLERRPSAASTSAEALDHTELAAALELIEPEARALLMLTAGLGYSFEDAAVMSGLPRGTVASRVARAKQLIRTSMGDGRAETRSKP